MTVVCDHLWESGVRKEIDALQADIDAVVKASRFLPVNSRARAELGKVSLEKRQKQFKLLRELEDFREPEAYHG